MVFQQEIRLCFFKIKNLLCLLSNACVDFTSTPQSDCLDDRPRQVAELKFPDKLPGELYNADIQCKWQFGSRARLCTYDFGKVSKIRVLSRHITLTVKHVLSL